MKVVLFCGGLGTRLRDYSEVVPKPLVPIGYRPVLWHVMKYYAHFGHNDFILCLGHGGDLIKQYFLNYSECISNDFVLSAGGKNLELLRRDIDDWRISFVDTGMASSIGQRLLAVKSYLADEPTFLANFSDGLTDMHLPTMIDYCQLRGKVASLIAVPPPLSFHVISTGDDDLVRDVKIMSQSGAWIIGGYFLFRREIFNHLNEGEDLADTVFPRLIDNQQLLAYRHDGFFAPLDTFKDKQRLDDLYSSGTAPWELWRNESNHRASAKVPPQRATAVDLSTGERR